MTYLDIHTHQTYTDKNISYLKNVIAGIDTPPDNSWFSAGVHPWYLDTDFYNLLEKLIAQQHCLAVGECGLDFMPSVLKQHPLQKQEQFFLKQAELAEQYQKPLIIHCVKCFDKLLALKKSFKPKIPWIIHGFSKNSALARQLTGAGFYLSFGAHLFKSDKNCKALQNISGSRFFLETDEQTDFDIKQIYQKAATIKQIDLTELQKQIKNNFKQVFKTT